MKKHVTLHQAYAVAQTRSTNKLYIYAHQVPSSSTYPIWVGSKSILETAEVQCHQIEGNSMRNFTSI